VRKLTKTAKATKTAKVANTSKNVHTTKADAPVHVLIRVRSESGQTITAHADILAKRGSAVLGKIGQPVGPNFRDILNQQIQSGIKTYLFLTIREGWNGPYVTYRCTLRQVQDTLDPKKRTLVPSYYMADAPKINTWFEITDIERLSRDEMNKIFVLSSGRSIMSVIASSAAVFRVGVQPNGRSG
jgi:hypothetical protein